MLELKDIFKTYDNKGQTIETVKNVSLSVGKNKFIAIVGPSGCGKTTLLKIVAGLLEPSSGEVILDGKKVSGPDKDRGMVFQSFALFPWLTVKENIAFGLRLQKMAEDKIQNIVSHYLNVIGLS